MTAEEKRQLLQLVDDFEAALSKFQTDVQKFGVADESLKVMTEKLAAFRARVGKCGPIPVAPEGDVLIPRAKGRVDVESLRRLCTKKKRYHTLEHAGQIAKIRTEEGGETGGVARLPLHDLRRIPSDAHLA